MAGLPRSSRFAGATWPHRAADRFLSARGAGSSTGSSRARLLSGASGRVLEVGAGVGSSLGCYPPEVDHLDLCEADPRKRRQLEGRLAGGDWPFTVAVHDAPAEGPFPGQGYHVVVVTLVLCSVAEPEASAAALRAVLADDGRLSYLEHVHAGGLAGRLQSVLSSPWAGVTGGCHLDRPPTAALRSAGLVPVEQRWRRLPPPFFLAIEGEAIVRVRPAPRAGSQAPSDGDGGGGRAS